MVPIGWRRPWHVGSIASRAPASGWSGHVTIGNEAIALFVRFWLTATPPLPDAMQAAAQAKGKERYDAFVEALGRRLAKGRMLADEITTDVSASPPSTNASEEKPPA